MVATGGLCDFGQLWPGDSVSTAANWDPLGALPRSEGDGGLKVPSTPRGREAMGAAGSLLPTCRPGPQWSPHRVFPLLIVLPVRAQRLAGEQGSESRFHSRSSSLAPSSPRGGENHRARREAPVAQTGKGRPWEKGPVQGHTGKSRNHFMVTMQK